MSQVRRCAECNNEVRDHRARCDACEAKSSSDENGMLATVDHSPSSQSAPTKPGEMPSSGDQFGEYRVIRQLGKGGMGSVYEAEEAESGRRVALKLFGQSLDSTDAKKRFIREGRLAASISHPNTVYVYGTEEINGIPTISMELVAGGTLEAKIRESGPMPVGAAVDTILQVIEGLDAAQKLGVLHRDIKPSNCFLDASGAVKVGDFGLSVSTLSKVDLKLTTSGSFVGTPSYASPEQLRGQPMDLRSDIYSVGVTLFYLLTGKIPFEAESFVQLIAAVLEQPTPSASQLRKEVPRELAAVVARCLDKQPAKRFQSYAELKAALAPFTSAAPVAAGLPLRMLAGLIDNLVLLILSVVQSVIASLLGAQILQSSFVGSTAFYQLYTFSLVWTIAYYALSEALWGATLGKAMCGLRVIGVDRGKPSFFAALIRAVIYYCVPCLPTWIMLGFRPPVTTADTFDATAIALALAIYPALGSLFITCRRRNGFASVHDLASGARVIVKPEKELRPRANINLDLTDESPFPERVGPYPILRRLDRDWLLAQDPKLSRDVWIRVFPPGSPPFPSSSSKVARVGRLRWLGGKREPSGGWDAFESASGASLRTLLKTPHHWDTVRFWLADLAQELAASEQDQSLPETLSLDRVWITADNRAKLLDVRIPGSFTEGSLTPENFTSANSVEKPLEPTNGASIDDRPRLLLASIAASALHGKEIDAAEARSTRMPQPLPLHATQILEGLIQLPPPQATADALGAALPKRVRVTRWRRLALVLACLAFPLLSATIPYVFTVFIRRWETTMPDVTRIHDRLELIAENPIIRSSKKPLLPEEREAVEIVIATRYAKHINDPQFWDSVYAQNVIVPWERTAAKKVLKERKPVGDAELAKNEAIVDEILKKRGVSRPLERLHPLMALITFLAVATIMYAAIPAWIAAVGFRGGLFLAMLGLVAVDKNGRRASRLRMAWRTIAAWAAVPLLLALALLLIPLLGQGLAAGISLSLFAALFLLSPLLPVRGIPDRLAGTYLVMK